MATQNESTTNVTLAATVEVLEAAAAMKDGSLATTVPDNDCASECSFLSRSEEDVARSALEVEADAFTRFIDRQRVETMFELRNLRLGERPVTGQPNRDRIQTFLNHIRQQRDQRTPSAQPAAPSAHIADINALATRRCVSAALGSVGFRQDLENAIRRSIEPRPAPARSTIPQAPPMPHAFTPAVVPAPTVRESERPRIALPPAPQPLNLQRQERELQAWHDITQLQREIIVIEISDLVHRQLVTSALESDFRNHLEQSILTRFTQGAPDQQAPPVPVAPRLPPPPAPTRPAANTAATSSTINELSTRLDSMQHTLQLMYAMQLDMQRSLRQEVASCLASASCTAMPSASRPVQAGHCTVCLTATADTVLYRCGHLCICYTCGLNLRSTSPATRMKCPICRAPVDDIVRVYRSSRDGESM